MRSVGYRTVLTLPAFVDDTLVSQTKNIEVDIHKIFIFAEKFQVQKNEKKKENTKKENSICRYTPDAMTGTLSGYRKQYV